LQEKPQVVPSQAGTAFGSPGSGQGEQLEPQLAGLASALHAPLQTWKPLLQTGQHVGQKWNVDAATVT
jgi:hypothetical protein